MPDRRKTNEKMFDILHEYIESDNKFWKCEPFDATNRFLDTDSQASSYLSELGKITKYF